MVVELSVVQVEDVKNPHSGLPTASTTNSTFNYVRDIAIGTTSLRCWRNRVADGKFMNVLYARGRKLLSEIRNRKLIKVPRVSCSIVYSNHA
jgi:hypothetical protein